MVNARLAKARRQLDATHEFQRMGALNGLILDADGKTVLLDLYDRFGVKRQALSMAFADKNTELRVKCGEALDMQEDALGSVTSTGSRAFCGRNFWNKLIVHPSVKETYLNSQQAAALRGDARESFEFGGIVWERYRGKVAGVSFVHDDKALLVPEACRICTSRCSHRPTTWKRSTARAFRTTARLSRCNSARAWPVKPSRTRCTCAPDHAPRSCWSSDRELS